MKKLNIFLLILIGFICIGAVSATDNLTDAVSTDIQDEVQDIEHNENNDDIISSNGGYSYDHDYELEAPDGVSAVSGKDFNYNVQVSHPSKSVGGIDITLGIIDDNGPQEQEYYGVTNKNGVASFKLNLPKGEYTIRVDSWLEDELTIDYGSVIVKNSVPIIKPTVKAPSMTVKPKAKKYFKIAVKNGKNPVKNLKLKVKVYTGKKAKTYTLRTDKKGVVKISTKRFKAGIHKVKITSLNKKYSINKVSKFIVQPVKFRIGKYTGTFTLKQIKAIKKAQSNWNYKTITVKTGKYYKSNYDGKKYPVKVSISAFGVDGSYPGNHKAFLESWSGAGPITVKKITIF